MGQPSFSQNLPYSPQKKQKPMVLKGKRQNTLIEKSLAAGPKSKKINIELALDGVLGAPIDDENVPNDYQRDMEVVFKELNMRKT